MYIFWLAGLTTVYICKCGLKKPAFINVLWALISLACLLSVISEFSTNKVLSLNPKTDAYMFWKRINEYSNVLMCVFSTTSHWFFASSYLSLVLAGVLILDHNIFDAERMRKTKRNSCLLFWLNFMFFALQASWVALIVSYIVRGYTQ